MEECLTQHKCTHTLWTFLPLVLHRSKNKTLFCAWLYLMVMWNWYIFYSFWKMLCWFLMMAWKYGTERKASWLIQLWIDSDFAIFRFPFNETVVLKRAPRIPKAQCSTAENSSTFLNVYVRVMLLVKKTRKDKNQGLKINSIDGSKVVVGSIFLCQQWGLLMGKRPYRKRISIGIKTKLKIWDSQWKI